MTLIDSQISDSPHSGIRRRQIISLIILLAGIALITGFSWQSVTAMVDTWLGISAYNHGLFIAPIAAYMVWDRRHRFAGLTLEPFWPGLIMVAGFAVAWLVARGAAITEGEQLAYVGMLQGLMLTILGRRIFRAQLLPIMYLWLMVPTGSFLLPNLQAIATWLTVHFLSLTSIPFFVEQFYIQLPVGLFFVAPGCAGLNFILASLALSIVYSDLLYAGWRRKIICIFVWLGVAVLANGIRIFAILWLAEITDRKIAIVDDHLLYGWGFFFVILIGLMMAGRRFSNIQPYDPDEAQKEWRPSGAARPGAIAAAGLVPLLLISGIMGYGLAVFQEGVRVQGLTIVPPDNIEGWQAGDELQYAKTAFPNADSRAVWGFEKAGDLANLFVAYYDGQWDGREAASDNNNVFGPVEIKIINRATMKPELNGRRYRVQEETVSGFRGNLVVWRWYCASGHFTSASLEVRLRAMASRMLQRESSAAVFTLFTLESPAARDNLTELMRAIAASKSGIMVRDAQGNAVRKAICW